MGRPALSETEKLESARRRILRNSHPVPGSSCWAHEGPKHYKLGAQRLLRPRTALWLASGRELPTPAHLYYVGQQDACTVSECVNVEHFEIKANASQGAKDETKIPSGGVLRGDPPDGAIWGEGLDVIWIDLDKWEQAARAKGKDDAWIAATRPRIESKKAAHQA